MKKFLEKIASGGISENPVIVSPDVNGTLRARKIKDILELNGYPVSLGCMAKYKEHGDQKHLDQMYYSI
jgi:phosphoribosylpyrophosphate synthetase